MKVIKLKDHPFFGPATQDQRNEAWKKYKDLTRCLCGIEPENEIREIEELAEYIEYLDQKLESKVAVMEPGDKIEDLRLPPGVTTVLKEFNPKTSDRF